ncbi:hypothetical protein HU200_004423 [Digitaria exilis]|uniref:Uncharacterized protein n=1 Tax=Digitaria exilis TaxID=1010633 RepID=A0A835FV42_9POAL|nr:hypothetical protein HU200_004423 [Digitaria exilis]
MGGLHKITLVLIFCLVPLSGRAEYLKYKDPKQPVAARVKDLLARMTIAEKIARPDDPSREGEHHRGDSGQKLHRECAERCRKRSCSTSIS